MMATAVAAGGGAPWIDSLQHSHQRAGRRAGAGRGTPALTLAEKASDPQSSAEVIHTPVRHLPSPRGTDPGEAPEFYDLRGLRRRFSADLPVSRSQVHFTSLAMNGLPSCRLTPWRNGKVS